MTKLAILVFMAVMIVSCNNPAQNEKKTEESVATPADLTELRLDVKGMTCEGCENAIKLSLGKVEGVYETSASHVDELVVVKYDASKAGMEAITEAITRVGYEVVGEKVQNEPVESE